MADPLGKPIGPQGLLTMQYWEHSLVPVVVRFQRPPQGNVTLIATEWLQRAMLQPGEIVAVNAFTQGDPGMANERQVLIYTLLIPASKAARLDPPPDQK